MQQEAESERFKAFWFYLACVYILIKSKAIVGLFWRVTLQIFKSATFKMDLKTVNVGCGKRKRSPLPHTNCDCCQENCLFSILQGPLEIWIVESKVTLALMAFERIRLNLASETILYTSTNYGVKTMDNRITVYVRQTGKKPTKPSSSGGAWQNVATGAVPP